MCRNFDSDVRAAAWGVTHFEVTSYGLCALAHGHHPKPGSLPACADYAHAVVTHRHPATVIRLIEFDLRASGVRVFRHVGQRFLCDTEQRDFHFGIGALEPIRS
jgi:hypothetical protein